MFITYRKLLLNFDLACFKRNISLNRYKLRFKTGYNVILLRKQYNTGNYKKALSSP